MRLICGCFSLRLQAGGSGELCPLEEAVQLRVQNERQPPHRRPGSLRLQGVGPKGKKKKTTHCTVFLFPSIHFFLSFQRLSVKHLVAPGGRNRYCTHRRTTLFVQRWVLLSLEVSSCRQTGWPARRAAMQRPGGLSVVPHG